MAQVLVERGPAASAPSTDLASELAISSTVDSTVAPDAASAEDGDSNTVVAVLVGLAALGMIAASITIARRRRTSPLPP